MRFRKHCGLLPQLLADCADLSSRRRAPGPPLLTEKSYADSQGPMASLKQDNAESSQSVVEADLSSASEQPDSAAPGPSDAREQPVTAPTSSEEEEEALPPLFDQLSSPSTTSDLASSSQVEPSGAPQNQPGEGPARADDECDVAQSAAAIEPDEMQTPTVSKDAEGTESAELLRQVSASSSQLGQLLLPEADAAVDDSCSTGGSFTLQESCWVAVASQQAAPLLGLPKLDLAAAEIAEAAESVEEPVADEARPQAAAPVSTAAVSSPPADLPEKPSIYGFY